MSTYLQWNDTLASHFFNPEMANRAVYLYVTDELISDIGRPLGADLPVFIAAVKEGPPWATREGLSQRAIQAYEGWRARSLAYPPYIAYLCLFVLAAGVEGDFAPHAYYPRLRYLLGLPVGSMVAGFDRMFELWEDLEQWSLIDQQGSVGVFKARVVGEWIHVGYPIAQTILSETEMTALPRIFWLGGLDPTSLPPLPELARVLRLHGEPYLRPRTRHLLESGHDEERYRVLLATVAEELADWDGHMEEVPESGRLPSVKTLGSLRLCLTVDRVARQTAVTLRCRVNRDFPEDALLLSKPDLPAPLSAEEFIQGWSSPLRDDSAKFVDASRFNWTEGLVLKEERLGWEFKLPGQLVRIFVNGSGEGLPGLVEVHAVPRSQPFFLAYHDDSWPFLERWAREECTNFSDYEITAGMPSGWHLASIAEAKNDKAVREIFPVLALPISVRLRLLGGIRSSSGNNFFAFAPPDLSIEGGDGDVEVWCMGERLKALSGTSVYHLPARLPLETRILIEVRRGERILTRQSLYLTGDFRWRSSDIIREFDEWGNPVGNGKAERARIAGATVIGEVPAVSGLTRPVHFTKELAGLDCRRVIFVGRRPGEIVSWPREGLPRDWEPVWAIPFGKRRGRAIFCGSKLEDSLPLESDRNPKQQQQWKEILWYRRKRITPPDHPRMLHLWNQFQAAARNV